VFFGLLDENSELKVVIRFDFHELLTLNSIPSVLIL